MDTTLLRGRRKGRPNYPQEFKRELAERACDPTQSVSALAREHGLNVNMLFKWRREYRQGALGKGPVPLLPVAITPSLVSPTAATSPPPGFTEIRIRDAVVRIEGRVEDGMLASLIRALRA